MPTGCCWCCGVRHPRRNRVSPHGLLYADCPHIVNEDGNYLFCRYWEPTQPVRALVMILHGAGEHSGHYMNIALMLTKESYLVFAHDHIGHGHSEGKRLNVPNFRVFVRDCQQHINLIRNRYPNLPLFFLAEGLGGAIAIYVGKERPNEIAGMIFMAPLVLVNPESATPTKLCIARLMYHLMPNLSLGYMDPRWLSRSQREVLNFVNDPLNYLGPFRVKFVVQMMEAVTNLENIFPTITWPVLILHGNADKLCDIKGSFLMYNKLGNSDKTLKVFKDAFHQLHKETPRVVTEVNLLIRTWLNDRTPRQETD